MEGFMSLVKDLEFKVFDLKRPYFMMTGLEMLHIFIKV